ncbi:GSCOCG00002841001-RA-CDS [Cotesia congregata]|nr:GSCOCG00002841001-RA-CDS [Cotesia congregata]
MKPKQIKQDPLASSSGVTVKPVEYRCPNPNCNSVYKWKNNLTKHMNYECGKPPRYMCSHCNYQSPWKSYVLNHAASRHPTDQINVIELSITTKKQTGNFVCPNPHCTRVYKYKADLTRHINYQCQKPPRYKCPYCPKESNWSGGIKKHIRSFHPQQNYHLLK